MKFKTLILQNLLLVFGVICIHKYLSFKQYYQQIKEWKAGLPVIDGDGVGLTFLGFPLDDDGVHWTEIMGVANAFLFLGILFAASAAVLLVRSMKKEH